MRMKSFWQGLLTGLVIGLLVAIGLVQALEKPRDISIAGRLRIVTWTHPDSYLNARLYVAEPIALVGPVYLSSSPTTDVNELVKSLDRAVTVRGDVEQMTLNTGESILTINPREVTVATPPP
ncbi:MAG: hypothetical protein ACFCVB_00525 [Nodosilinea sp.]